MNPHLLNKSLTPKKIWKTVKPEKIKYLTAEMNKAGAASLPILTKEVGIDNKFPQDWKNTYVTNL